MAICDYSSDLCNNRSVSFSDNLNYIFYEKKEEKKEEVEYVEVVHNIVTPCNSLPILNDINKEEKEEERKEKKTYSTHTKFCSFGLNKCSKGNRCIYAHTFKQLNPILCKWNEECLRKEKCYFKHSTETKVQYVKRAFPEDLKRLNIVIFDRPVYKSQAVKLHKPIAKIELSQEEEEERKKREDEYNEECKKSRRDLYLMYYDPAFEHFSWADINEFNEDNDRH
jgi:hypothetical protein